MSLAKATLQRQAPGARLVKFQVDRSFAQDYLLTGACMTCTHFFTYVLEGELASLYLAAVAGREGKKGAQAE